MKNCLVCALLLFVSLTSAAPAKDVGFPKEAPVISIAMPEGWKTGSEDGRFHQALAH